MKTIFGWILGLVLLFVAFIFLTFQLSLRSRYKIVASEISVDLEEAKKVSECLQNQDSIVSATDSKFWQASPMQMYWQAFILRNEDESRKYSSRIYAEVSRHYLWIAKDKIGFKSMAAWHLNGMAFLLAIEKKIGKKDLVTLDCYLRKYGSAIQ